MKTVTVPALKAFDYRGRSIARGETVRMPAVDAAIHARKGHVTLSRNYKTRDVQAETSPTPEPEPDTSRRRRYRRRDLVAEP